MSESNGEIEVGEAKEKNFAEVLKLALSHATFENKDIGGYVYSLLDSLAADQVYVEFEESDTTVSIMSDLVDAIREEVDDIAGRIDDEDDEEDEDKDKNGDGDDDDEDSLVNSLRTLPDPDDEDDEDDDDDLPEELGVVDEDDDDEIVDPTKNDTPA